LARQSVVVSKSRRLLSVPFEGKDAPSRSAEFAHPDILIGLSVLSYRLAGLRLRDVKDLLQELKMKLTQVIAILRPVSAFLFTFLSRNLAPWPFEALVLCLMNGAAIAPMEALACFHLNLYSHVQCLKSSWNFYSSP
jgi:hypothetical protein